MKKTILGIGDSLVYSLSNALFAPARLINAGVPGDETTDVIRRFEANGLPCSGNVFILVGINDLLRDMNGMCVRSDGEIIANIITLAKRIRTSSPEGELLIVGLLPVAAHTKYVKENDVRRTNMRIRAFNIALRERATMQGLKMTDVNPFFSEEGRMARSLTTDGIHLTEKGNEKLACLIKEHFFG